MGNSKIKNLQEQNAELRKLLERTTSERDNWEITARDRARALGHTDRLLETRAAQLSGARAELRAIARKAESEKREKHLAELGEGIVRLGDAEVTVSKKNDGESWVTVEFKVDADELRAVEGFLSASDEPEADAFAPAFPSLAVDWSKFVGRIVR